jgi:hypothetical protein
MVFANNDAKRKAALDAAILAEEAAVEARRLIAARK